VPNTYLDRVIIGEDRSYQTRFWRAQRVAWVLLGALLVASLLGLTGGTGHFAYRTVEDAAFSIRYPAILRRQARSTFSLTLVQPLSDSVIHFDQDFQRTFEITTMSPLPVSSFATSKGAAYRFEFQGDGPATLHFGVTAHRPAYRDYRIVANGRMALLTSTVLP
jgi:hypothetical protein